MTKPPIARGEWNGFSNCTEGPQNTSHAMPLGSVKRIISVTRRALASSGDAGFASTPIARIRSATSRSPARIGDLPSRIRDVVGIIAMQREAISVLVHAQQQPPVVGDAAALQAEDLGREIFPRVEVFHAESEIAEASYSTHCRFSP